MPVCNSCPNFISPGVARCENCNSPAGELFDCPNCRSEMLVGDNQCPQCHSYISDDGEESSEYSVPGSSSFFDSDDEAEEFDEDGDSYEE